VSLDSQRSSLYDQFLYWAVIFSASASDARFDFFRLSLTERLASKQRDLLSHVGKH
jgi:hypothetical protein